MIKGIILGIGLCFSLLIALVVYHIETDAKFADYLKEEAHKLGVPAEDCYGYVRRVFGTLFCINTLLLILIYLS